MENTEQKQTRKAKRRLTDISFDHEGSHIALVHENQGHGANGHHYSLCLKANEFSEEFLEKMNQVQVTMEVPEFLERFFKLEKEDVKFLSYLLGYREDMTKEAMEPEMDYKKWIEENTISFEVIKTLKNAENYLEVLSDLSEEQYLNLLQTQEKFEKALKEHNPVVKATATQESPEVVETTKADVNASTVQHEVKEGKGRSPVVKTKNKGKLMSKAPSVEVEVTTTQEMVEKSAFEAIQKQFAETQEALEKAMATVAQFEQEKKELIAKQRLANLEAVVAKEHADVIFKAVKDTADEDFQAVVKALGTISAAVAQSDLFVEKGVVVEDKPVENQSAVARLIKAKLQAKQ